nr:Chain C, Ceramide synthase 5 derived peptide Trh4 p3P [Mus musculus]5MZM_F Chain F, Ceramide synthase 5 derived peptide Trh4 p3P [Mus musculus]
MCPRMTAVM